jgi:hypothetical protein
MSVAPLAIRNDLNAITSCPGYHAPVADALGEATTFVASIGEVPAVGAIGSLLDIEAATGAMREAPSNSRRARAAAVHANGAAAGSLLLLPKCSHDHSESLRLEAWDTRAAVITGADAAAGIDTCTASEPASDGSEPSPELRVEASVEWTVSDAVGSISGTRAEGTTAPSSDSTECGAVTLSVGER